MSAADGKCSPIDSHHSCETVRETCASMDISSFPANGQCVGSCQDGTSSVAHHVTQDGKSQNDVISPDISLSSQNTLRYEDVEPDAEEHNKSHESSDSIETIEDLPGEDSHVELNHKFLQHLKLTQNASESSLDSLGRRAHKPSLSESCTSSDSHEVIPDASSFPRPESLLLHNPVHIARNERSRTDSENSNSTTNSSKTYQSQKPVDSDTGHSASEAKPIPIEEQGAYFIDNPRTSFPEGNVVSPSLPDGTITRQGGMIQFVANDLTEKIKLSSPKSQTDTDSWGSRRSSVRSIMSASSSTSVATSSNVSRSPSSTWQQSPDDIPPIDAGAIIELEARAQRVADSLDLMMGNIRNNLHKMSAITIGCQEAYKRSVDITCDSVDTSIKTMYALMAKCEELSTSMKPVDQLATQIKEIKRILELFEQQLTDK